MTKTAILRFILLAFITTLFACEERLPEEPTVPEWLQPRIEELEASDNCIGCTIKRTTYLDEYYFHVYCNFWSCSHCEVYHHDGQLVNWEEINFADFLEKQVNTTIIWQCNAEQAP
jgi:hypothetical protein